MHAASPYSGLMIGVTFLLALLLMAVPLPVSLANYRPEWLLLLLFYWSVYTPQRVDIGIGWLLGLLLDALQGTLLGEYALIGLLTAYVGNQLHLRLQLFPVLQQSIVVFLLFGTQFILVMWIQGLSGKPIQGWQYGLPVVVSAVLWPLLKGFLHSLQKKYRIR